MAKKNGQKDIKLKDAPKTKKVDEPKKAKPKDAKTKAKATKKPVKAIKKTSSTSSNTQNKKKVIPKSTPSTRSNSLKNKIARQNTFGKLDILEDQKQKLSNNAVLEAQTLQKNNISADDEDISLTPTFGS